ncbi:MAG: hypothetical protein IPJ94_19610 [Chloroflexi bacterium]|nr:hypothetical protein [Chloroflexota bacterium]
MPAYQVTLHNDGPALWPQHKPLSEVLELRDTTPELTWSGTYQGARRPAATSSSGPGGPKSAAMTSRQRPAQPVYARHISWDTGLKDKEEADTGLHPGYTVAELWPDYRLGIRYVRQNGWSFPTCPTSSSKRPCRGTTMRSCTASPSRTNPAAQAPCNAGRLRPRLAQRAAHPLQPHHRQNHPRQPGGRVVSEWLRAAALSHGRPVLAHRF